MCWNEPVSWTTFILGTLFNIFNICYFRDTTLTLISILIQWLLLMQFFEALAWRDQNCGSLNAFATNGALVANLTQPIVVCMSFLMFTKVPQHYKLLALGITFLYISYILYKLNNRPPYTCLKPTEQCTHLDLVWWRDMSGLFYCMTLFSVMLLLIRPFRLSLFVTGYIASTLVISLLFYSCSVGSMWCWFTSFAPIIITIYWYFYVKNNEVQS